MSGTEIRWHVHADVNELVETVAAAIASTAAEAIKATGRMSIVLSGGSTPRPIYERLVDLETAWECWSVYFSDERCVPIGDPERNDTMARDAWLDHVPIPADRIHAIPAELGPKDAATRYARVLAGEAMFDLTLLGLGEDGHTASLFPGLTVQEIHAPDALPVPAAPKPPAARMTMSPARLSRSNAVFLIVTGEGKREVLTRLREGADMPIHWVTPANGIDLFVDSSAVPAGNR